MPKYILLVFIIFTGCSSNKANYPLSDHFNGKTFMNPWGSPLKSFWDVLKWRMTAKRAEWPEWIENKPFPFEKIKAHENAKLTFINHASFLIQFPSLTILTDPIWSLRASPVSFAGPKRVRAPGLSMENLPKIDVIIISHNHYDHLNTVTLLQIQERDQAKIYVPLGDAAWLKEKGIHAIELDWWQIVTISNIKIHFTPATHWSARGLTDKNESLWGSYLIQSPKFSIYFAGDTGMGPHFKMIHDKLGAVDLALLPIGAYEPRDFMKDYHTNPAEAVEAMQILRAQHAIGMHFGTFQLSDEAYQQPEIDLTESLKRANINLTRFVTLEVGESRSY
jgi:N-acyl-phosphatidylethanolamine-hydrolysing phospholipase D